MAIGVSIICLDVGGLKDIIHNNINGISYKFGDLSSLYKMFCKILSMKSDELSQLSISARDIAQKIFSLNVRKALQYGDSIMILDSILLVEQKMSLLRYLIRRLGRFIRTLAYYYNYFLRRFEDILRR